MNYEQIFLKASATQFGLLGSLFFIGLSIVFPSLQEAFWVLALVLSAVTLFISGFALRTWWRFKRRLQQRGLETYSPKQFFNHLKKRKFANTFLLGKGFAWNSGHCQAVHNFTTDTSDDLADLRKQINTPGKESQGLRWLQALSEEKDITIPEREIFQHALLVGSSGSGKTSALCALTAQAIAKGMCVIVIDPKGDNSLFHAIKTFSLLAQREFKQLRLGHLDEATPMNLLANFSSSSEVATRIGQILPGETNDPFRKMSEAALRAVSGGMGLLGEKPTFNSLQVGLLDRIAFANRIMIRWLTSQKPNKEKLPCGRTPIETFDLLTALCDRFEKKPSELTTLIDFARKTDERLDKTISPAKDVLAQFTVGKLGTLLSPSLSSEKDCFTVRKLIERNSVFYLGTDALQDVSLARSLSAFFLTDLASAAGDIYNYEPGEKRKVFVVIDEASEACCEALTALLGKARGAGISLILATQSLEDFTARLGSKAEMNRVLANITSRIVMRIQDSASHNWISDQIAQASIKTRSRTRTSANGAANLPLDGVSIGERENVTIGVPLIAPDLYAQLPKGEAFVICQGGRIFKTRFPYISQNEDYHGRE